MKFNYSPAPNYRSAQSTKRIMIELLLGLLVVYAFSLFYYATQYSDVKYVLQALKIMAVAVLSCLGTEAVWALCNKKNVLSFIDDSFPYITGVILALMMPISVSLYAVAISAILCILFGKLVFGGFGQNIFNPAALGRAFIFAAFSGAVTDVVTGATPTTVMAGTYKWFVTDASLVKELLDGVGGLTNLLFGMHPGALGETSALLIAIVGIVLAIRKVIDWRVPVVYVGGVFVITTVLALVNGMGMWYPVYHVLTGGLMFGAVFMATDPVTSPTSATGRSIFALGCAILTVLIRVKANLPEGVLYSILIMNCLSPMIERFCDGEQNVTYKRSIKQFVSVALVGLIACVGAFSTKTAAEKPKPVEPKKVMVNADSKNVQDFAAEVTETVDNGDGSMTYTVAVDGFAAAFEGGAQNVITVVVKDGAVVSVEIAEINDTEHIGTNVDDEAFLSQFVDQTVEGLEVEAVSGATLSSSSVVKAVLTALGQ